MRDFETSKCQDIVVSHPTRELLVTIYDEDLPFRSNLIALDYGQPFAIDGETLELGDSGHMLGSAHVRLTCRDGVRVGYSSDFFWPLDHVLEVDELLIDATYGSPDHIRTYDQRRVEEEFVRIVASQSRATPIVVAGFRGRLQHAMALASAAVRCPLVCSKRVERIADVYRRHRMDCGTPLRLDSPEGRDLITQRSPAVIFLELPELRKYPSLQQLPKVTLSAFAVPKDDPVLDYGDGDFRVALTDHADFPGTLDFIRASRAARVYVYPFSGSPDSLVDAIRGELRIHADLCPQVKVKGWG